MKLTAKSERELKNYHVGSGMAFFKTEEGLKRFDIRFVKTISDKYVLAMGNSKFITLTPEQVNILGVYAEIDKE